MIEPVTTNIEWLGLVDEARAGWFNQETRELAPGFPLSADDVLVDVGAGSGGIAEYCSRYVARTILVEPNGAALTRTLEALRARTAAQIEGLAGDAADIPLPDGFASRVLCMEVLEHVDDPEKVMAELVRIGRPGALYLVSVPGALAEHLQKKTAPASYFQKPNHLRIFEEGDLARLVEGAGLTIERETARGFFWTVWWTLFWAAYEAAPDLGSGRLPREQASHPLLEAWSRTWGLLLAMDRAEPVKAALDELMPKSVAIIARKPG